MKCKRQADMVDAQAYGAFARSKCLGIARPGGQRLNELGHELYRTGPLTWCNRCACHGQTKPRKLLEQCRGFPTAPAHLRRLRLGQDPQTGAALGSAARL